MEDDLDDLLEIIAEDIEEKAKHEKPSLTKKEVKQLEQVLDDIKTNEINQIGRAHV